MRLSTLYNKREFHAFSPDSVLILPFSKIINEKMPKTKKKQQASSSESDSGPEDRNQPASKKAKESAPAGAKTGAGDSGGDGATTWTLEGLRQVRINEFRGRKMVDIREFYEKNGETLPGKKGISLSIKQWKKLLEVAEEVTRAVEN
ncbi:RNA polymerase II transcriptional coactivator [Drosophila ficusphila]|uniref:RNA polymerase II transcriptional coactivator n=1 Tax=Drosophila ficusphila TaxID=30025 RepID=UPI001C893AB1|nr:RNA polymerase II transcriptional coactivator [Drosophila ficusphila]